MCWWIRSGMLSKLDFTSTSHWKVQKNRKQRHLYLHHRALIFCSERQVWWCICYKKKYHFFYNYIKLAKAPTNIFKWMGVFDGASYSRVQSSFFYCALKYNTQKCLLRNIKRNDDVYTLTNNINAMSFTVVINISSSSMPRSTETVRKRR